MRFGFFMKLDMAANRLRYCQWARSAATGPPSLPLAHPHTTHEKKPPARTVVYSRGSIEPSSMRTLAKTVSS